MTAQLPLFPDTDYVLGIWYLAWPGHQWLLIAMRAPDGEIVGTSKLRYADGTGSLTEVHGPAEGEDAAIARLRRVVATSTAELLSATGLTLADPAVYLDEVLVQGTRQRAYELLWRRPWIVSASQGRSN